MLSSATREDRRDAVSAGMPLDEVAQSVFLVGCNHENVPVCSCSQRQSIDEALQAAVANTGNGRACYGTLALTLRQRCGGRILGVYAHR